MIGREFVARIKKVPALTYIPTAVISIMTDYSISLFRGVSTALQKPISVRN